jgi:cell division septum initiation protein DivIVA
MAENESGSPREFTVALRGYDREEVDAHISDLYSEIKSLREQSAPPPRAVSDDPKDLYRRLGDETSRILVAAEDAAAEIKKRSEQEAAGIVADARRQAAEAARALEEQRRQAEAELAGLREARDVLATQLEDVGRRMGEAVARLRSPVEAPPAPARKPSAEISPAAPPTRAPQAPAPAAPETRPAEARPSVRPVGVPPSPRPTEAPPQTAPARTPEVTERPREAPPAPAPAPTPRERVVARASEVTTSTTEAEARAADTSGLEALLDEIRREREKGRRETAEALGILSVPEPDSEAKQVAAPEPPVKVEEAAAPANGAIAARDEALREIPGGAARRLKRLLQEDQNLILDRLRQHKGAGSFDESISNPGEHLERFHDGMGEHLAAAFRAGLRVSGGPGEQDPAAAVRELVSRQLVTPLRKDLARIVDAGFAAGDTTNAIAERASDVFRVWKGVRTELLGEGLTYAAFHQGLISAWRERSVERKRWVLSSDEVDCPKDVCKKNASAGAVSISEAFLSGHLAPPAHGGCTCTLGES